MKISIYGKKILVRQKDNIIMNIRYATLDDAQTLASIEASCFPKSEAANLHAIMMRLTTYEHCCFVLEVNNQIVSFISGMYTNTPCICDSMYDSSDMYQADGVYFAIFSVSTHPDFQGKHYASTLMNHVIATCKSQNRKGMILTCKKQLLSFYEQFGFNNQGISSSTHGDAVWYDMYLDI
ncbi:ribosomal protein S18 acetylase RimI-like enzyme [Breznakia blatticola]|uniref:Ribosomal protein S18 acetylase RimI-like enzyme n=2 Tax=Breznakia blatticola TaxID=1754012 RepID=A0A4R8A6Y9_9FIRM|nr:ribosomal protein S18 acetylase RimI-like enzyme [Breznakia blatticola]